MPLSAGFQRAEVDTAAQTGEEKGTDMELEHESPDRIRPASSAGLTSLSSMPHSLGPAVPRGSVATKNEWTRFDNLAVQGA
jgi:hypothetical protein